MARRNQSTGDLLVLMIAGTVCLVVVGSSLAIIIGQFINPDYPISDAAGAVGDIISTLIGLLAGFLAGRTDTLVNRETPTTTSEDQARPPR